MPLFLMQFKADEAAASTEDIGFWSLPVNQQIELWDWRKR